MVFDFVDGGAEDEFTLAENRRAFSDLAFRARVLVDVAERPQATTLLGRPLALPVVLGPAGLVRMAGRAGEAAAAVAAQRCGTVSVVSSGSSVSLADVASAVGEPSGSSSTRGATGAPCGRSWARRATPATRRWS